jgi:hypothetical protein
MKTWLIKDSKVRELLVKNGFKCEKDKPKVSGPGIHFFTQTQEQIEASQWYLTDCPVEWSEEYTLPDGSVIASKGTSLILVSTQD